jgi:hypothetical protein
MIRNEEGFCRYNFGSGTDADTFTVEVGSPRTLDLGDDARGLRWARLPRLAWVAKDRGPRCIGEQKGRSAAPKSAKKAPREPGARRRGKQGALEGGGQENKRALES